MIRVLVVDDEQVIRDGAARVIAECIPNSDMVVCGTPSEALEAVEKRPFDIAFLDIEMPLMDGHRLTKLIKSDDKTKKIPVVIFSSLVNDEMRKKGEQLGADAQLSKPEIGNLVREIDRLVNISAE